MHNLSILGSVLLTLLMSFNGFAAYPIDKSFVCPEKSLEVPSNIVCCDTLENKTCAETLDALATKKQQNILTSLGDSILAAPPTRAKPSCFGTSLALLEVHPGEYTTYLDYDSFFEVVTSKFIEVSGELRPGDLVLFDEQGFFNYEYEHENTSGKYYKKEFSTLMAHASVYLGNGLVLQKENAETAVGSISTLERALERYNWGVQQTTKTMLYAGKNTTLVVRVFRKI